MNKNIYNGSYNIKKQPLQPFFSIIITTYNRANILKRAIDSLISQTEKDWEAIIIDDASIDDTYGQVLPYLDSNPEIKYIRKTHSGEALSKNAGIMSATGKFISFLDSDDEYNPEHLRSRKKILLHNPAVRFLYGGAHIIGNMYVPDRFDPGKRISLLDCVIGGTFFIERSILIELGGFKEIILGTDADLFERAVNSGICMKKTKIPSYIYHHENEDSITNMLAKNNSDGIYSGINQKKLWI
jgi:glycosyltransferase involved in cell wall biosynthesis